MKRALAAILALFAVMGTGCIMHATHYTDTDGSTVYVGELYSEGNSYNAGAQIQGTFLDGAGNVIATATGATCEAVDPKHVVPFKLTLPPGTAAAAKVEWKVLATPVANAYLATGLEADVLSTETISVPPVVTNGTQISGMLKNTSANQYFSGFVCVAWLNDKGDVVREQSAQAGALRLSPGGSVPFVIFDQVPPEATHMAFFLDAGVEAPGHPLPTAIDIAPSAIRNASASAPGVRVFLGASEVVNTGSTAVYEPTISVVGTDADGKTVVGESAEACPFDIPPGATSFAAYGVFSSAGIETPPAVTMQTSASTTYPGMALVTSGVQIASKGTGTVTVTGTVKNSTAAAIKTAGVCVGVYNASGQVQNASGELLKLPSGSLAPNATMTFSLVVPAPAALIVSAKAVGIGYAQ